ncbi:DUF4349 domain-containing protein [Neolewinella antarctica]|uniref:DUF4349 domain-containing protein n=1 Tax=Neolewinella antarctica TaxID=442734 RepID=A0ABX0XGG9_9BACT|nr:DUF4349 domain-containing protein [Neolewinella antarctica]NJC28420.1 hypothetical protein [Neolewinella antarctica]
MKHIITFLTFSLLFACGQGTEQYSGDTSAESYESSADDRGAESGMNLTDDRAQTERAAAKIIKNGRLAFKVKNLALGKQRVDSLLRRNDAYYEREEYQTSYGSIGYVLVIRVPVDNFELLLASLEGGTGQLTLKEVSASDVTEEYVDLGIRLENKLAYLAQYKEILKKARTIEEILQVQEKIRVIEEEIESKKGRLRFLDNKVGFSTIQVTLTEVTDEYVAEDPGIVERLGEALKSGATGIVDVFVAVVYLWPVLLILLIIFIFRSRIFRKGGSGDK